MGRYTVTLLLALSVLSITSAFHTLVPNGKELVYDYKALITAGTAIPASYVSQFRMHGKLHIQSEATSTLVQLSDLKYKLYNGEGEYHDHHHYDLHEHPIPKEAEDLLKPFKVVYNSNGQAKGIATEKEEKMYARNMHKAIAHMLQMDVEKVHLDSDKAHAFMAEEHTIYGKTVAAYNVLPKKGDKLIVQKMHEMKTTKPMYHAMITNMEPDYCEAHYEEPMSHDSQQFYMIIKQDGHHLVKHLESTGGIYLYPFQAKSEAFYVYTNVTLNLIDVVPVQKALHLASEHMEEDLMYDIVDPSMETDLPDILNGRREIDMKKHMTLMETMMTEFGEYIHKNHIHMDHPDIKHGQLVNRMVRLLTIFDHTHLEQMYNTLSAKTSEEGKKHMEVFHQLLPLVGTHASVMLLKKIVHEKKVDDHVAMHMLHNMPFHVRLPTEKMLHDMEDMMTWGKDVNVHVHNAAILSFASLIHKTFEVQKSIAQGHHHHHHQHDIMTHDHEHINLRINGLHHYSYITEEEEKFINEHKIYDKYVTDFFNKMKSAEDMPTKALYMQAMYNTKLHGVVEHLVPIVKGKEMDHHLLRMGAMWAIAPMVVGNHDLVYELYWPIFSDWSQNVELRILAYYIIMESHPPISRLLNMYWELFAEPSTELYHFHYTYLWSMAHTTDPCHQVFRLNAAQILKYTPKPNQQGFSLYHQMDYIDKEYKFGGDFSAFMIATETSREFVFKINSQMFNIRHNYYSFYIRIDGLTETLHKKLHLNLDSATHLFNYDEAWNMIKSISDMKDIRLSVGIGHNHQVVQSCFFDHTNMKELHTLFTFFHDAEFNKVKNSIEIHYDMYTQILFPTEMGIPAIMEILMPTVHHKHINMRKETENNLINFHFDNKYHISRHSRYGLSFYNPIADVWQGINRFHSYDFVLPLYADVTINTQQHSMKISMKKHQDHHKDEFGMRSHVTSMVFVKDDLHHDVLKKSCEKCESWDVVTKGDHYRHNNTMNFHLGLSKHKYTAALYDSEVYPSYGKFINFITKIASKHGKNYWTDIGYFVLLLRNWHMINMFQPTPGTHGIMIADLPDPENVITQVDLTFRVNKEVIQEKDHFLPGLKYNPRVTYTIKNKEKTMKTWDMNALIELNVGHTLRSVKLDISRIIPGQKDFKICLESTKKWIKDGVNGHMTIHMGQSADGKCNRDDASIEVTSVGEYLHEQTTPYHTYEICQPFSHHLAPDYHSMYCTAAHTSVRKYTYDIKTHNIPSEYKKTFFMMFDNIKEMFKTHYHADHHEHEDGEKEDVKVVVKYPTAASEMDLKVITPHHVHEFNGISIRGMPFMGFHPDNTHYSKLYMMMHYMGMMHTCTVHQHDVRHGLYHEKHVEAFEVPKEWTMFVGDAEKDCKHGVFLKKIEGTNMIALKTMHGSHSVEIHPEGKHGEDFKILVDGKEMSDAIDYHTEDWFALMVRPHIHGVVMTTFHFHLHMEYTGDKVIIEIPKVHGVQFYGHCIKH